MDEFDPSHYHMLRCVPVTQGKLMDDKNHRFVSHWNMQMQAESLALDDLLHVATVQKE